MSIGYACLALAVPNTALRTCLMRNASDANLREIIAHNISALEAMVRYNIQSGIRLYRISSDIIPFASSPVNQVHWHEEFGEQLSAIGMSIRSHGMRVSMHPGQYTVLNSPNEQTVANAVLELAYHAEFLDLLGVDKSNKIILHVGGVYGDRQAATERFIRQYQALNDRIKARLVIENDERCYSIAEVLSIGQRAHIPVVFDNLHHAVNPSPILTSDAEWVRACAATWTPMDGRQKIHYSQPDVGKKSGAHSASIGIDAFMDFYRSLGTDTPDIMLEVKDKNISARKCVLCTNPAVIIGELEKEWARYKYLVLEHSQAAYQAIRLLLKDKSGYPAISFFRLVEEALACPVPIGGAVNAAQHVWGYFKQEATPAQQKRFENALSAYIKGEAPLRSVKGTLQRLADIYRQDYLLESYYFLDDTSERAVQA